MNRLTDPIARLLISVIFIAAGIEKITHFSSFVQSLGAMKIPLPALATAVTILIEIGGGLAILVGWHTRLVAWVQFLYLIAVTLMVHNFWAAPAAMRQDQEIHFMKNLAILGGLLFLTQYGPGETAVDTSRK